MIGLLMLLAAAHAMNPKTAVPNQKQLNAITASCGTPRAWLRGHDGAVYVDAGPNPPVAKTDCVFRKLLQGYRGSLMLVGNAAPSPTPSPK